MPSAVSWWLDRAGGDTYYIKGGLRERWHPLGHTVLYAEYEKFDDAAPDVLVNLGLNSSTQLWGLGVVQEIDAAAMSLWISYRHIEADIDGVGCASAAQTQPSACRRLLDRQLPVREGRRSDQLLIA